MEFKPRELAWTAAHIERFWTWYSSSEARADNYFSKQVGDKVVDFAAEHGALIEPVLDYGCGPGYLLEHLLARGVLTAALDNSESSLNQVRLKFGDHPRLEQVILARGLPTDAPEAHYGSAFFVETVEHLLDDELQAVLAELRRVLKPGGRLIVTTPNDENLAAAMVVCPDCGAIFHRMQHLRSFIGESLAALLRRQGFEPKAVVTTTLIPPPSFNSVRRLVHRVLLRPRVQQRKAPHLFVVAERS